MNINEFAPKHININEAKAKAVSYEGSFEELRNLYTEGKVTLVTDDAGNVNGIWVDSATGDVMTDNLSGENFHRAYCCKPVMEWIGMILRGEEPAPAPVEEEVEEPSQEPVDELPTEATINYDELDTLDESGVKKYLRNAYGHYLSGFEDPIIEFDDVNAVAKVSNIEWGRKRY